MLASPLLMALLPFSATGINVVQSNDDGWAEMNIREFYYTLTNAGFNSIISAPADNRSGTGSADVPPSQVGSNGCEFNSCPPGSPPTGRNASMPRFNYVHSFPVTSMRFGIQNLSAEFFSSSSSSAPDLAVAGPNVGANLGATTQISGTVGAAVEAVKLGVPAIAFSGTSGSQTAWDAPLEPYATLYAELSTRLTLALVSAAAAAAAAAEQPILLPPDVFLNVNFPAFVPDVCSRPQDFHFVLSRVYPGLPLIDRDVATCGREFLPTEREVVRASGCYASVSVATTEKLDADADAQAFVLDRLRSSLSCLPGRA